MALATALVAVAPAAVVWALSAAGVIGSLWLSVLVAAALSLAASSAGSAYWRRHSSGEVLFSDLLVWGWLRRRRIERRMGRADVLLQQAAETQGERRAALLAELGAALDAHDPYLDGHSRRVARYGTMTARRLELPEEQVERVKLACLIHDIGKLRIPEQILGKPGGLTDDEFAVVKTHPRIGGEMAEVLGDAELARAVRGHHERFDGSGYPDGLAGAEIPVEARVIGVADTFDSIVSARAYRPAAPHQKALSIIAEEVGAQLDPEAARAFISCYSDRRGAALWAGLLSLPRQLAERVSSSPGGLTGVLGSLLVAPLVVVSGAAASAALPARGGSAQDPVAVASPTQAAPAQPAAGSAAPASAPGGAAAPASAVVVPLSLTPAPVLPRVAQLPPEPAAGAQPEPLPEPTAEP